MPLLGHSEVRTMIKACVLLVDDDPSIFDFIVFLVKRRTKEILVAIRSTCLH